MSRTPRIPVFSALLAVVSLLVLSNAPVQAQVQPSGFVYEAFYELQTNGANSSYMQALTHRYVGSELRFLYLTHQGVLQEFRLPGIGQKQTATTATWNLAGTGALNSHNGIWYEQAKNRLWVTSAEDYTTVNHPAKITLITLGTNGSVSVQKQIFLNVPAKRVYGGCNAVPAALVGQLGGPYVCGWGGYTSLVAQGGGASMGPTMYAIPDPDTVGNGATVPARTILDTSSSRGVRKTLPINFFDGGDARQNPSSRPTGSPLTSASWLSPGSDGLGWFVWGDSYYNTGMWIGTTFASVASLCKGACWYQDSTLNFDARQFELHLWNGTGLGSNQLKRPDSMTELNLPQGIVGSWAGNVPQRNVAGATYDSVSGRAYLVMSPAGNDWSTGRLYSFVVNGGGSGTPPPPPVSDSTAPTVSVTSPAGGTTLGSTVGLSANASDNVAIGSVWFTVDGTTVGTEDTGAPYSVAWNSATFENGSHTVRAMARDTSGNVTTSAPVAITINNVSADNTAPSVSLSAPANNANVSGTVAVSATAADNVAVTSVQFTLNGVNLGTADTSAPYSVSWNTSGAANGSHTLRAVARDAAGNTTTSATRTVNVNNASTGGDDTDPVVSLTSPSNNSTVDDTITVAASASDNVGVVAVQFTLNGVNLGSPDTSSPYRINWNTGGAANGTHTLRAIARDAAGNTTTSAARTVRVSNSDTVADSTAPTVSLTSPSTSTINGVIVVSATASDNVGVTQVQFTLNGTVLGVDTVAPYAISWSSRFVVDGVYLFGVTARDAAGNTRSATRTVTVRNVVAAVVPPVTPTAPTVPPSTCTSMRPAADWVCYNGGWLPPSLAAWLADMAGVSLRAVEPSPAVIEPVAELSSTGCSSPAPGSSWVCRNGGWLPPGHPDA